MAQEGGEGAGGKQSRAMRGENFKTQLTGENIRAWAVDAGGALGNGGNAGGNVEDLGG
jgi:hypothetical protein